MNYWNIQSVVFVIIFPYSSFTVSQKVKKMPCSAVTLSIATITAIVSAALMAIAFSTDNWLSIEVKRSNIQVRLNCNYFTTFLFFFLF